MIQLKNKKLVKINLQNNTFTVDIAIKEAFIQDWDSYSFKLTQRMSENVLHLPYEVKEKVEDYVIFTMEIPFFKYKKFFTTSEATDISIVRQRQDEELSSRIKSNYDNIEFLKLELEDGYIFYASTTRQGNLSFYWREAFLYAKFEKVELGKDGLLSLQGIYQHNAMVNTKIKQITLLVSNNLNEDVLYIPVEQIKLSDKYSSCPWYINLKDQGFQAIFDIRPYITLGEPQFFKFKLLIALDAAEQGELIESNRIKVNHLHQKFPLTQKVWKSSKKVKISCKPTKKSKYFSLRVAEYKPFRELVSNIRRRWILLRRSKSLLKMFQVAFLVLGKILPVKRRLVMFESFHGKQFSDSPRAVYEYMKAEKMNYEMVWSVDRRHLKYFKNRNLKYVRRFSIQWLLLMSRSKYWITNARLPLWIPKPNHTTYVQTWHGTPLKRLAADMEEVHMPGTNTQRYKENFTKEASKWDFLISPNVYSTEIFRRAFQFNKEVIESGYPRNDYLTNSDRLDEINSLKEKLDIDPSKKVILYAPTWRDNQFHRKGKYKFNLELDLDRLYQEFGDTHVIVLRMHYLVSENLDIENHRGFVYDLSKYEDIRDLYLISDMLITDYSSVFFDYANLRRPILFFVYDIEDYRDNLRGFYFDFEQEAPGPLVKDTEQIITEIKKVNSESFKVTKAYQDFYNRFCYLEDGNASKRVVRRLFER